MYKTPKTMISINKQKMAGLAFDFS